MGTSNRSFERLQEPGREAIKQSSLKIKVPKSKIPKAKEVFFCKNGDGSMPFEALPKSENVIVLGSGFQRVIHKQHY